MKGGATIEIIAKTFDGTAVDLYQGFVEQLSAATTVSSSTDPSPSQLAGLKAVEGTIHFRLNGTDATSFAVAGVGGGEGVTVSFFGPLSVLQPLKGEFEAILASISVTP